MLTLGIADDATSRSRLLFSLRNDSSETIRFLYWNTIFDPVSPKGLWVEADSLPVVKYRGATAKYRFDPQVSLIGLGPGETIERVIDVAENYRLPATTSYTVVCKGPIRGIVGDVPDGLTPCDLQALEVTQKPNSFQLVPVDTDGLFPAALQVEELMQPGCAIPECWKS